MTTGESGRKTAAGAGSAADRIRTAHGRNVRAIELRPSLATGTAVTRVEMRDGMTCEVEEGPYRLVVDMPEKWGGKDLGPNPGVYGRAALGSCLAIAYVRWAVQHELPIHRLQIEIQADYDARGELGMNDDVTPAYTEVRYVVSVESEAPEEEVRRVFDLADRRCPYLHVWTDPLTVRRDLRVAPPSELAADGASQI